MSENKKLALVDTDFVKHIISSSPNGEDLLKRIFDEFNIKPLVHPWVAKNEFIDTAMKRLLSNGLIETIQKEDIVGKDDEFIGLYEAIATQMYSRLNEETIDFNGGIFEIRRAHSSLGEIHGIITAKFLDIPILCSDDHGTKDLKPLIDDEFFKLEVFNAFDVLNQTSKNDKTRITYKECEGILSKANETNATKFKEQRKIIKANYNRQSKDDKDIFNG